MATSSVLSGDIQSELLRRHKAAAKTVVFLLVGVILLCVLAFVSQKFLTQRDNPSLHMAVLVTILIFGFGAIAFRRTKFAVMRLQDISALRGPSGLLNALQKATLQVAFIGAAVAVVGFAATLVMGNTSYSYRAGVVAGAVLLYCYPVRSSWEQALRRFAPDKDPNTAENPS